MVYARYRKRPRRFWRSRGKRVVRRVRPAKRSTKRRFIRPSHPRGSATTMRMRPAGIVVGKGTGLTSARKHVFDWKVAAQDATRFLNPIGLSAAEWKKLPSWAQAIAFQSYGKDVMKNALAAANLKPEHWARFGSRAYDWARSAYDAVSSSNLDIGG